MYLLTLAQSFTGGSCFIQYRTSAHVISLELGDADQHMLLCILAKHQIKLDYGAIAQGLGEHCTARAVEERVKKLKKMAKERGFEGLDADGTPKKADSKSIGDDPAEATPTKTTKKRAAPAAKKQATAKDAQPSAAKKAKTTKATAKAKQVRTPTPDPRIPSPNQDDVKDEGITGKKRRHGDSYGSLSEVEDGEEDEGDYEEEEEEVIGKSYVDEDEDEDENENEVVPIGSFSAGEVKAEMEKELMEG